MGEMVETTSESSGAMNRRNLLKGAAAVGVGAAVWTVPSITSLGGTPAYAATCTGTVVHYKAGFRNTSCSCQDDNGNKYIDYKPLSPNNCGDTRPIIALANVQIVSGSGSNAPAIGNDGDCAPGLKSQGNNKAGTAYARITNTTGLTCRVEVRVTNGQCGNIMAVQYSDNSIGPGQSGSLAMPKVPCGSGDTGNLFTDVGLVCSADEDCIYPPPPLP